MYHLLYWTEISEEFDFSLQPKLESYFAQIAHKMFLHNAAFLFPTFQLNTANNDKKKIVSAVMQKYLMTKAAFGVTF